MTSFRDVPENDGQKPRNFADPDPLPVPTDAETTQDKHGVVRYFWDEIVNITKAIHITTDAGLVGFVVEMTDPDRQLVKGFGLVNYQCYGEDASPKAQQRHQSMSDRSLGVVRALLEATDKLKLGATLTGKLVQKMFPPAKGDDSPLIGCSVIARLCDEPDTRPRKGGSLPKPGTRRTVVSTYRSVEV